MIQPFKEKILDILEKASSQLETETWSGIVIHEINFNLLAETLAKIISSNPPVSGSLPQQECECMLIGLGKGKWYRGECKVHGVHYLKTITK